MTIGNKPPLRIAVWLLGCALAAAGCSSKDSSSGTAGSAGPSLDAPSAEERAAAAREAEKKFGS